MSLGQLNRFCTPPSGSIESYTNRNLPFNSSVLFLLPRQDMRPNFDLFSADLLTGGAVPMLMMLMREGRGHGAGDAIQVSLPSL